MFPFILLVSLAALVMGMLNAKTSSACPRWLRASSILARSSAACARAAWIDPQFGPRALVGLAIGTADRRRAAVWCAAARWRGWVTASGPICAGAIRACSAILLLMGPSVIAASTTQFNVLINSIFASKLGDGPIFWLSIAFRLMQLPLGLFGVALGR